MIVIYILLFLIILWVAVVVVRAALYNPPALTKLSTATSADRFDLNTAANHLAEMIRCQTVLPASEGSREISGNSGYEEYEKFRRLLVDFYPRIHRTLELEIIYDHSLLYRWAGKSREKPLVLMAHYDVVQADEGQWQYPPFEGIINEGIIWGRGTLDTKSSLCGILEAVEALLGEGFEPERDIYMAFGHDEETSSAGAQAIVERLGEKGVSPEMVLDEGGAIIKGVFPGVAKPIAVVGMAEKGVANIEVILEGSGGHSSTPGRINPLGELSKIILRLAKKPFRAHISPEIGQMFDVLGRHTPFYFKLVFANLWCFKPLLLTLLPLFGRELEALCRSTCVFTMAEGSKAHNVIPDRVRAVANLRLAAQDSIDEALDHLTRQAVFATRKAAAAREPLSVQVNLLEGHNASPSSDGTSKAYSILEQAIVETFPETLVTPFLVLGASDSRYYCEISKNVFRFSPIQMNKQELESIHGIDEHISIEKLGKVIELYLNLIGNYRL